MRGQALTPRVVLDASLTELMKEMSDKGLGASAIVDSTGHVLGIFTDGDLRRLIESGRELRTLKAGHIMHPQPKTLSSHALAVEAVQLMEQHRINSVLVTDDQGLLCGSLNTHDLMRAKVI